MDHITDTTHLCIMTTPTAPTLLPGCRSFPLFHCLPTELRLMIWSSALASLPQQMIKVNLCPQQGGPGHGFRAVITMRGQSLSQVFFVDKESRKAAQSAYRVQIPCWSATSQTPKTVYFCPERDFVQLKGDLSLMPNFLHDMKMVHDRRKVGVLNLVVGHDVNRLLNPGLLLTDPSVAQSFRATTQQLRHLFFIYECYGASDRRVTNFRWSIGMGHLDLLDTSRPIEAEVAGFNMIGADPRDIARHLRKFRLHSQPKLLVTAWKNYLHRYLGPDNDGIAPTTQCRILLTSFPRDFYSERGGVGMGDSDKWELPESLSSEDDWDVRSCERAQLVLQAETEMLVADRQGEFERDETREVTDEFFTSPGYCGSVDVVGSPMQAAFGFWLFPVEAFEHLPEPDENGLYFPPGCHGINVDLSEHWPELALMDL
ncbi:hypothetical protein F5Y18DRAFT_217422 [Xylariaceae sp. FL1019]|nr:hypothetical protein F5Y18DRAFT_217422 [Xylariaceae sp. FL1019]